MSPAGSEGGTPGTGPVSGPDTGPGTAAGTAPDTTPGIRIGDRERDQAIDELREQYVLGRLDHQEFERRLESAFEARTAPELRQLVADLPAASQPVDWRPGRAETAPDHPGAVRGWPRWGGPVPGGPAAGRMRHRRHGHGHGAPWAYGSGRHPYGYHHHVRGPGFLPLLPIVGMALFFGGWALMFLLPLLIGGLLFSVLRRTALSR